MDISTVVVCMSDTFLLCAGVVCVLWDDWGICCG